MTTTATRGVGPRGTFVAFEGGEGAGKTTQINLAAERARSAGREVVTCREPGGTPFGEAIRKALLHGTATSPRAELLAFNAARAELTEAVITPALARGAMVLCDRFSASTVAYQQYGRGLDSGLVSGAIEAATGGLAPDLNVLLDVPAAAGLARAGVASDRFEAEALPFHERVRQGFLAQASAAPERWLVLDAAQSPDALATQIWAALETLLARA